MLDVASISKTFNPGQETEVRALVDASLAVPAGSWTIVIGGNGSGKSSLLNAVAGSFQIDSGSIAIDGTDVTRLPQWRRAVLVGRVFQDPFAGTAPALTVAENLALAARRGLFRGLGPLLRTRDRAGFRDRVASLGLGLENRMDQVIGSLSGGQRQSLTLLMATLRTPALLLLDEHTAALDPKSAELVIAATRRLIAADRLTVLMVTHSMQQAADLGDRLVVMHRGGVERVYEGAAKNRLRPDQLTDLFAELRMQDRIDTATAGMLAEAYIEAR